MANVSVTYSFTNSTTADADEVNTNFTDIINGTSDGSKDFSISALTLAGTFTANANCTFGNATSDDITFTGSVASDIPIKTNNSFDIGSATLGLAKIYLGNGGVGATCDIISASHATTREYSVPDCGAAADFVMTQVAQTISGAKTLSTGLVINEDGDAVDTRIEGDTEVNLIFADASADRVGMGTSSPGHRLHVVDNSTAFAAVVEQNNAAGNGLRVYCDAASGTDNMLACNDGTNNIFVVRANGKLDGLITNWASASTQDVGFTVTTGAGAFNKFTSSRRYKHEIANLSFDSSIIYNLTAQQFKWNSDKKLDFGFIAEEVAEVLPQAVNFACDENGLLKDEKGELIPEAVKYRQLTALIVEEMKILRERIKSLEAKT
tara:strand:+ start:621 stop:1757 length:1137 start_codon:yes stop_codon:yes gene_type:complete